MRVRTTSSGRAPASRERDEDDLEAAPRLLVRAVGRRRAVGHDGRRSRDVHVRAGDDRAREARDGSYGEPEEMRRRSMGLVSRRVEALAQVEGWGAGAVAVAVLRGGDVIAERGPRDAEFRWASITKPAVALATLVAAEEGVVDLDEPAGPEGSTVRHLLAHASGLPFHGDKPIARPGTRRIYSNTGFEQLAAHVERAAEMPFAEYLRQAVFAPLGMSAELLDARVRVDPPPPRRAIGFEPLNGRPDACASRWRIVEPSGPAGSSRSITPSSAAISAASASGFEIDAQRKTRRGGRAPR